MSSEAEVKTSIVHRPSSIVFPPWQGEFGWEVMTWAPWCRKMPVVMTK
jgi:hypothetical protein